MKNSLNDVPKKSQYQKAFLVTEDTHTLVKQFCKINNIKINIWVDNILRNTLQDNVQLNRTSNDC